LIERTGAQDAVEIVIDVAEALLEPANVLEQIALDDAAGEAEAILLGRKPVDQLSTPRQDTVEELSGLVGSGARLGPHALGKLGEDGGIEGVGLGESSEGFGEVAPLAGMGHDDGKAGFCEGGDRHTFEAPGGFEHDERRAEGAESRDELL